jgi:2-methylcitrate dehydratase PrpD
MNGITERLARFVADARYEDLPHEAPRLITDAVTDAIGCSLAGSREQVLAVLARTLPVSASREDHLLLGSAGRANMFEAALYNGTAIHAIDYDDTSHPSYSHPSAHLVPALLAAGRHFAASGREIVLAYALGLELVGKLGRALNTEHYLKGWHSTGTFGAVASAIAAAKLARLDAAQTATALAIAASAAGGLRANFGTMTKPLHAGYAARSGLLAVMLAREGFTAAPDILESRYGYLNVFSAAPPRLEVFEQLGAPWEIDTPYGIAMKPFPACGSTHTAIEASLALRAKLGDGAIEQVRVGTNELCSQTLIYTDPRTPLEGKFSMEFCVAAALVRGEVNMGTFTPEVLADARIRALMKRITVEVDERVRFNSEHGTVVSVTGVSGVKLEELVPLARGKPERWMSRDELKAKFLDCASCAVPEARANAIFERLQDLAQTTSVDELLEPLEDAIGSGGTRR